MYFRRDEDEQKWREREKKLNERIDDAEVAHTSAQFTVGRRASVVTLRHFSNFTVEIVPRVF